MAEIQQVSSPSLAPARRQGNPRPRLPHPPRYNAPLRLPLDETQDLRPPLREEEASRPVAPQPAEGWEREPAVEERPGGRARPAPAPRFPPRTRTEWLLMATLLLGLTLNAAVLLMHPRLTSADILLGATVLVAGIVLLVLMELCRWTRPSRR
jgi:hypothetical protein